MNKLLTNILVLAVAIIVLIVMWTLLGDRLGEGTDTLYQIIKNDQAAAIPNYAFLLYGTVILAVLLVGGVNVVFCAIFKEGGIYIRRQLIIRLIVTSIIIIVVLAGFLAIHTGVISSLQNLSSNTQSIIRINELGLVYEPIQAGAIMAGLLVLLHFLCWPPGNDHRLVPKIKIWRGQKKIEKKNQR